MTTATATAAAAPNEYYGEFLDPSNEESRKLILQSLELIKSRQNRSITWMTNTETLSSADPNSFTPSSMDTEIDNILAIIKRDLQQKKVDTTETLKSYVDKILEKIYTEVLILREKYVNKKIISVYDTVVGESSLIKPFVMTTASIVLPLISESLQAASGITVDATTKIINLKVDLLVGIFDIIKSTVNKNISIDKSNNIGKLIKSMSTSLQIDTLTPHGIAHASILGLQLQREGFSSCFCSSSPSDIMTFCIAAEVQGRYTPKDDKKTLQVHLLSELADDESIKSATTIPSSDIKYRRVLYIKEWLNTNYFNLFPCADYLFVQLIEELEELEAIKIAYPNISINCKKLLGTLRPNENRIQIVREVVDLLEQIITDLKQKEDKDERTIASLTECKTRLDYYISTTRFDHIIFTDMFSDKKSVGLSRRLLKMTKDFRYPERARQSIISEIQSSLFSSLFTNSNLVCGSTGKISKYFAPEIGISQGSIVEQKITSFLSEDRIAHFERVCKERSTPDQELKVILADVSKITDEIFKQTLSGTKNSEEFSRQETKFIEQAKIKYKHKTDSMMSMCKVFSALDSRTCFDHSFVANLDPNFKVNNLRRICEDIDSFGVELPLSSELLVSESNSRRAEAVARSADKLYDDFLLVDENDDDDDDKDEKLYRSIKWFKKYLKYKSKYLKLKNKQ